MKTYINNTILLACVFILTHTAVCGVTILGPAYPPVGGTLSFSSSGSAGNTGGQTRQYTNFIETTGWDALYFGPNSGFLPKAGLDGTLHDLTFQSVSGTVARWEGTTQWTNPQTLATSSVTVALELNLTGLGANPWIAASSIPGLDPGPGAGISVVVDNTAGADFTLNLQFLANVGNGWVAINTVNQPSNSSGLTRTSVGTSFYSAIPEPSTMLLSAIASLGLLRRRRA